MNEESLPTPPLPTRNNQLLHLAVQDFLIKLARYREARAVLGCTDTYEQSATGGINLGSTLPMRFVAVVPKLEASGIYIRCVSCPD